MVDTLLILVGAWVVLTCVGVLVLAPLDRARREALLPGAPLFGVVLLVVVLHDTTLVWSVRTGLWFVATVLVGLAVVAFRRDAGWWRPRRESLATLGLAAACGVLPAFFALGPSLAVGDSNVVQPSDNNDAFYYVTVAGWLQDHAGTDPPEIGVVPEDPGEPPSALTARSHLDNDLRMGQELVHGAVTTVLGSDVGRTWYPLTALWVLLLPAAGVVAARCFRLGLLTGLVLGTMTSLSALVIFQLGQQNSDSLLGTAVVLVALGAVVRGVGRDPLVPRVLAGLTLTAVIGTYTEFTPLVAPALAAAVLARPVRELPGAVRSAVVVLAFAVASAPLAWVRAVRSLLFLGGIQTDTFPSAFHDAPLAVIVGRFLGVMAPQDVSPPWVLLVLVTAFVLTGVVSALVLSPRRWFWLALVVVGTALSVYFVTVRERPYTQQRVVQLFLPLVLLVAAAGWDRLVVAARARKGGAASRRSRPHPVRLPTVVATAGLAGAAVFMGANAVVDHGLDLPEKAEQRHVGPEFAEAADWVRDHGGPDGAEVSVLVGDFFSQLWITDALRDLPDVAYPSLYTSYQAASSFWSGVPRRWLITDRAAIRRVDDGVVVQRNARFALIDLRRGRVVLAVPADEFGMNSYLLLGSPSAPSTVTLKGSTRERTPTDPPARPGFGDVLDVDAGTDELLVELDGSGAARVILSDDDQVFMLTGLRFR